LGPIPNPQSPIPNPQSPFFSLLIKMNIIKKIILTIIKKWIHTFFIKNNIN